MKAIGYNGNDSSSSFMSEDKIRQAREYFHKVKNQQFENGIRNNWLWRERSSNITVRNSGR